MEVFRAAAKSGELEANLAKPRNWPAALHAVQVPFLGDCRLEAEWIDLPASDC